MFWFIVGLEFILIDDLLFDELNIRFFWLCNFLEFGLWFWCFFGFLLNILELLFDFEELLDKYVGEDVIDDDDDDEVDDIEVDWEDDVCVLWCWLVWNDFLS